MCTSLNLNDMLTIRAMSNGQGYAARHLQHRDYYAEGERVVGQWQGRGAGLLGLSGVVEEQPFEAVRQGLHPETGEYLRPRQSADRMAANGTTQSRGRNLYDFTFSAPKSVSILAQLGRDERLIAAHHKAVDEVLTELERYAASRVRQGSANADRPTGNLVLAVYHHDTSRELDPQLHTHAVAGNLTFDGEENRWKALQASGIYQRRAYLSEVYRNALARQVRDLGYEIEDRHKSNGQDDGFEIRGVSQELIAQYSQRSQQRDAAIAEFERTQGRHPSDNEVALLIRETRADKLTEISTAEVRKRQLSRLSPEQVSALQHLWETALRRTQARALESVTPALAYAQDHLFERVTVARDYELLAEALRRGRGRMDLAETKEELRRQEFAGTVLRTGIEIATQASLDRERQMIAAIHRGIDRFEPLGGQSRFVASGRLSREQRRAVEFVLTSRDLAVNVCGAAGTGKTATLAELRRGIHEGGGTALAVAPTMSAVEELQKVGFGNAMTVDRLLQDQRAQTEAHGKILIVDEAGMLSGRQMSGILELAEQQRNRIVYCGDTKQLRSVEAYDALRILEKESSLKSISITKVQRQTVPEYREAIQELRRDPKLGFEKLEQIGAVREVPWQDRARTVAEMWREAGGNHRNVLVVCATHEEIGTVTEAIRAERRLAGELGESVRLERYIPLNYTAAQKSRPGNFLEGQVLVVTRATKDMGRNEALDVVRVDKDRVVVRSATGAEREVTGKQAKCFEVYERRSIEISPHDKLLLTANRRDARFRVTNGQTATVSHVDAQGRIHLKDGRILPANYKHFDYGYAITAHRSQGKSVDTVVISADAMRKELFYVAASRGRISVAIVTSDRELLRESVGLSGERQSASELVRKRTVRIATPYQQIGREAPVPDQARERG